MTVYAGQPASRASSVQKDSLLDAVSALTRTSVLTWAPGLQPDTRRSRSSLANVSRPCALWDGHQTERSSIHTAGSRTHADAPGALGNQLEGADSHDRNPNHRPH